MLRSCSSPVFSRVLALEYFFEEKQPLQFHVFDAEDGSTSPRNDTFLGSTECTLGQVCVPTPTPTPRFCLRKPKEDRISCGVSSVGGLDPISAIHPLCSLGLHI